MRWKSNVLQKQNTIFSLYSEFIKVSLNYKKKTDGVLKVTSGHVNPVLWDVKFSDKLVVRNQLTIQRKTEWKPLNYISNTKRLIIRE